MADTIENILKKEQQAEEESKILRELSDKINQTIKLNLDIEKSIKNMETEVKLYESDLCNKEVEFELSKIVLESWDKTYNDAIETQEKLQKKTDELDQQCKQHCDQFCNQVNDFIDVHGVKATLNRNFNMDVRGQMAAALSGADIEKYGEDTENTVAKKSSEYKEFEDEIQRDTDLLEELKKKYQELQKKYQELQKSNDESLEYVRLKNALKYSRAQTLKYQATIENKSKNNVFEDNTEFSVMHAVKQTAITDFINVSDKNKFVNRFQYSGKKHFDATDIENGQTKMETSQNSYKLIEVLEPSTFLKQGNLIQEDQKNKIGHAGPSNKKNVKNVSSEDFYKKIHELKEKSKTSNKRQTAKFTRKTPKKSRNDSF